MSYEINDRVLMENGGDRQAKRQRIEPGPSTSTDWGS